jgi:triacylglycerol esterase/lipase EstA (alpha/beta hydrolase family)
VKRLMCTVIALLAVAMVTAAPARASSVPRPVAYSGALALTHATLHPDTAPAGSNDWSCRPGASHPRPVVLLHGTLDNMTFSWFSLSPYLSNRGYCVFAFNFGQEGALRLGLPGSRRPGGTAPVARSAGELAAFVDRVLAATKASKVDIVGHSQGGMMPRYYLRFLGGAAKVGTLVGLSPSNHGTTLHGLGMIPGVPQLLGTASGQAVRDQIVGSPFLSRLNAGGDTVPGVRYTVITSRYDEVVTPYTSSFLSGPNVTNILLQDHCPLDTAEHTGISYDANALHFVGDALDPAHATPVKCRITLPINGG